MPHGEFSDFEAAIGVPHGGDELTDLDARAALGDVLDTGPDTLLHGLDNLVEAEPAAEVLLGGPTDFTVDDAVGGEVFDEVTGDAHESFVGLHHSDRDVECPEVFHEGARVGLVGEPRAE